MTATAPTSTSPQVPAPERGAAEVLADIGSRAFGGTLPVRVRAWDGTVAGPDDAPTLDVRSPDALRRLLYRPGQLGLAQAYVTGEIDVEGDLLDGFRRVWRAARAQALDPHMAYSCAYFTSDDPAYTLEDAQRDKLDLVCRKLGLHELPDPASHRHLDIGCGWGALSVHAAKEYGVRVVGVTLSAEQKAFVDARVEREGLQDRVEIRLQDYREVVDGPFGTVSSIEMGEHVGKRNYPTFVAGIERLLSPGGRALVQQMSRTAKPGGGPFIEAFIAPDMHMRPVGETVDLFEQGGLEVRDVHALREHYVRTVDCWYDTFDRNWDRVVEMVGEEVARMWRLYLVGGALAFEEGRMGVDQILAVKATADGRSGLPPVRAW